MKRDTKAEQFFTESDITSSLERVYQQVPNGTCSGSTNCCSESVNTFYAEYLNMILLLEKEEVLEQFTSRAVEYYLTELVRPMKCPMLQESGLCILYEARPLPCRVFGHLKKSDYDQNYEAVLESNLEAAEELLNDFGIKVPQSVCSQKIEHCTSFSSDEGMSLNDRDDLVDLLFSTDSRFFAEGLLNPESFNLSLVQWFAYATLGEDKAKELRIKISQEISSTGESATLTKHLCKLSQQ